MRRLIHRRQAGSGIVSQHDYDPESSCSGWGGCEYWSHGRPGAWWNVTQDPEDEAGGESPLWAFTRHRALNRLALRTKLPILATRGAATPRDANPPGVTGGGTAYGRVTDGRGGTDSRVVADGGALVYLKHDALGPDGEACLLRQSILPPRLDR